MRDDAVLRRALPLGQGLGRGMKWTRASLTMQLTCGVGIFAHMCEQMLGQFEQQL